MNNSATQASILPTSYLGNIYYYSVCLNSKMVYIELYENYPKQTFRNRCHILNSNGTISMSIPIEKKMNNFALTKDIKISYKQDWITLHLRTIKSAYSHSPFFEYIYYDIEKIIKQKHTYLIDLNQRLNTFICAFLGIDTDKIKYTDDFIKDYNSQCHTDLRFVFKETKLNEFLSNTQFDYYTQVFSDKLPFSPNLSIIDLIFNAGNEALIYLKNITGNSNRLH